MVLQDSKIKVCRGTSGAEYLCNVTVGVLDYLDLLMLLLEGRGELESLRRKALLRSVLGRAKLRQHYREEKGKAGQS